MPPRIRRAAPSDIPAIVGLWRLMWDFHTPLDPRFTATPVAEDVMAGWIEQNLTSDRAAVFVAEEEPSGELEGYCLAMILENPPVLPVQFYGYISEMSVRRPRGGTGGKLMEAARGWFREARVPYAEVNVSVKNEVARKFWRKMGFAEFLERLRLDL